MALPNLFTRFTAQLDNFSWILGLVLVFAISLPTINIYRRRSMLSFFKSAQDNQPEPSPEPALINGKPLSQRKEEPNFGFGEIRVSKILIHPIKSCRGTSVNSAYYTPEGLVNDRKWCIVEADTNSVITARDFSKMVLINPVVEPDKSSPYGGVLRVSFPAESECEAFTVPLRPTTEMLSKWTLVDNVSMWGKVMDGYICESLTTERSPSAILSAYFDKPVHLLFKGPQRRLCSPTSSFPQLDASTNFPDGYPLLVLSEESVEAVERETRGHVGKQGIDERWKTDKLVIERFRPNIVFKGGEAFTEDWVEEIGIGSESSKFFVVSKCARCLLPNVCPEKGIRDKAVPYKVMMKFRIGIDPLAKMSPCLGCNAVPTGSGEIKVGDLVSVRRI